MESLTVQQIIDSTHGVLLSGDAAAIVTGISTDSRTVQPGDLFIALSGPRYNGHAFCQDALAKGAVGVVCSVHDESLYTTSHITHASNVTDLSQPVVIMVPDTVHAYGDISAFIRLRWQGTVVAVTGSTGKTTVKEMLGALLPRVKTSLGNYNNLIGVPHNLCMLSTHNAYAVIEMGMSKRGEIRRLMEIAQPDVGIITNVSHAHVQGLGSLENVAAAKGEMCEQIQNDGILILNRDDHFFDYFISRSHSMIMTFGDHQDSDVRVSELRMTPEGQPCFTLSYNRHSVYLTLPVFGKHNAYNFAAAAAAACALGISLEEIAQRAYGISLPHQRLERMNVRGAECYFDAYNANPASVKAAIDFFATLQSSKRKIVIFGGMYELGDYSDEAHRLIGEYMSRTSIDGLICIGPYAEITGHTIEQLCPAQKIVRYCADTAEAKRFLQEHINQDAVYLLKGSRAAQLEEILN